MKILIMCEGPNELKIINLLLDNGKLKFTRDDLLDMRPFHARQLTSPQLKPALDAYHGEIAIYRIGDKMTDSLKIPKELLLSNPKRNSARSRNLKCCLSLRKTKYPNLKKLRLRKSQKTSANKTSYIIARNTTIPLRFTKSIFKTA